MNKTNYIFSILVLLLTFTIQSSFATIYKTTRDGNFNSNSIWTPYKPHINWEFKDTIYISHSVNITNGITLTGHIEVKENGIIKGKNNTIKINRHSTFINNGKVITNKLNLDWSNNKIINNGIFIIKKAFINKTSTITNNGTFTFGRNFTNSYSGTFVNNGILNAEANFTNENEFTGSGDININGNFINSWHSTFSSTGKMKVIGNFINKGNITLENSLNIGGFYLNESQSTFNSTSDISINGKLTNKGNATFGGYLDVNGDIKNTWSSVLIFNDTVSINGDFSNFGPLTINNTISLNNFTSQVNTTFNGTTTINGDFKSYSRTTFNGNTIFNNNLTTNGNTTFNGNTTINGDFNNKSNITNIGNLTITGDYNNKINKLSNSGTINIIGDINNNNGNIHNDGIIVIDGNLTNNNIIKTTDGSVFYVKGNLNNLKTINNEGYFYVDEEVTGNGHINGEGSICNSDGETNPISNTKGNTISCRICDKEQTPLPVQLIHFEAYPTNSNITISWTTANEENNDYFEVLRSEDGKSFDAIAKIAGAGNSNITLDYSFIDNKVKNKTYYYILKQTDYDNKFTTSDMVVINLNIKLITKVYPNPITQGETLNIEFSSLNNNQINIYDINGKAIKTINSNAINETIDISELSSGIYIIQIQNRTQTKTEKLIIQ